jgi:C-terminal processing protease CtpA/Prc
MIETIFNEVITRVHLCERSFILLRSLGSDYDKTNAFMRKLLSLVFFCIPILVLAQRTFTTAELSRLADLGKVWGILHNFHPSMARGIISTDGLVSDVAANLANDPSAANFKICLEKMFSKLKDPLTHIIIDKRTTVKLLTGHDTLPSRRLLPDSILYVAFPTSFGSKDSIKRIDWLRLKQLEKYKAVVLDLRNEKEVYDDDYYFMQNFGDSLLKDIITGPLSMPLYVYRYQSGFIDQAYGLIGSNIYSAGWQTSASDRLITTKKDRYWKGQVVVVINKNISTQLMKYLLALRSAGYCKIIFDGEACDYATDAAIDYYTTADSLHLKIRVLEYLDINGKVTRDPDLFINGTGDENAFLEKCRKLALMRKETTPVTNNVSSLDYIHSVPHDTNTAFASVGERLLGLYNYWNAINYFNPNKHLLKQSWDSVLTDFIPRFINANDTASYYFTITDLVSHIHDSHGFFGKLPQMQTVTESYSYTAPLSVKCIQGKYYIVSMDSALGAFQLWDEIIAVDSIPVNTYKQTFRSRFAYSNDWTFERDLCGYFLLNGRKNSLAHLTILRNGKTMQLNAARTVLRYRPDYKQVSFNDDHKDIELLSGNIGYVNMGSLSRERIDKIFDTLMHTNAIIFDIRNYPQGTAWNIVPRLTDHDSVAVKFGKPYVTYESVNSPVIFKMSEYFIVNADKTKAWYKGKIIMLCDETTQSQAEYTIMMFQGAAGKRVTVVGSATAGADGNVTGVRLPGGYTTYFSGLEVLYPDGSQTQQTGIRVNIKVERTVAALKQGKDEVLQRAIQFIESGK